jgi:hypothetical protein
MRHLVTQNGNVLYLQLEHVTFPISLNMEDLVTMLWFDGLGLPVTSLVSPKSTPLE